jgi:ankyrin repeat protein
MLRLSLVFLMLPALAAAADDPLVRAAAAGDGAAIRALLKQGHDVNATGPDGATALHWAVRADDIATVEALLRGGAKVGVANALGVQPAYVAAQNGNAAMLPATRCSWRL